ncbi:hypothetical protein AB0863_001770, partial [Acinetobacter baumannii]
LIFIIHLYDSIFPHSILYKHPIPFIYYRDVDISFLYSAYAAESYRLEFFCQQLILLLWFCPK